MTSESEVRNLVVELQQSQARAAQIPSKTAGLCLSENGLVINAFVMRFFKLDFLLLFYFIATGVFPKQILNPEHLWGVRELLEVRNLLWGV